MASIAPGAPSTMPTHNARAGRAARDASRAGAAGPGKAVALASLGAAGVGIALMLGGNAARGIGGGGARLAALPKVGMALAGIGIAGAIIGVALLRSGGSPPPAGGPAVDTSSIPPTVTGTRDERASAGPGPEFALTKVASGLSSPVQVTHAPGDDALYVVEQGGLIKRLDGDRTTVFADLTARTRGGGEQGLLSVAFHPDYETNGRLYVNYTDRAGDTHVAQLTARNGRVDPSSHVDLMVMDQPMANHNGGQLQFGPDGYLYIGMGDGGGAGDTQNRSQNPNDYMGKMLRIDVDNPEGGKPYGIPDDNMFASGGGKPEIWGTGLRNPWRFSFDAKTGDLWIGDVGQGEWEEIDFVPSGTAAGTNFGWNVREGANAYRDAQLGPGRLLDPILQYSHDEGSSVTGGYVYRGEAIPSLKGWYVYADIAANEIRALRQQDNRVVERRVFDGPDGMIVAFGEDARGELYAVDIQGSIFRFDPSGTSGPAPVDEPGGDPVATTVELGAIPNRFRFDRDEIRVPAGKVTLEFNNNDGTYHNIHVRGNGVDEMGDMVRSGQTSRVTVDLAPGTYTFLCTPHEGMGMKGTLIVE